ncbi:MAG: PAS domain S-box protein, partial [Candidatus Margulisiibacteriota bacterium]
MPRKTNPQNGPLYQQFFEQSDDVMAHINKQGIILDLNERAETLSGYKKKELVGKRISRLFVGFTSKSLALFAANFARRMAGKKVEPYEVEARSKSGQRLFFSVNAIVLKDEKGKKTGELAVLHDITSRKDAEDKLKAIFKSIPIPAYLWKKAGNDFILIDFNEAAVMITKGGITKFMGTKASELFRGTTIANKLKGAYQEKASRTVETLYSFRTTGKKLWLNVKYAFIEPDLMLVLTEDIDPQKKSAQKLLDSENRYRELFNRMSTGVAVYEANKNGTDFIFKDFNRAAEKIDKTSKEELIGKSVKKVFPGVVKMGLFDVFQKVWKTGRPISHPVTLYKDQRLAGWRENFVYKLPTGEIVAIYQDRTGEKQAEMALRESEEQFRSLAEGMPDGVLVGIDGKNMWVNQAFADILGYTRKELAGMRADQIVAPESLPEVIKKMKARQAGKDVASKYEIAVFTRSGERKFVEVSATRTFFEGKFGSLV